MKKKPLSLDEYMRQTTPTIVLSFHIGPFIQIADKLRELHEAGERPATLELTIDRWSYIHDWQITRKGFTNDI